MKSHSILPTRLVSVNNAIDIACKDAQRNIDSVCLLAVSKRHKAENIQKAFESGQKDFGENYLTEALEKQQTLSDLDIIWHYIGSIQSNKTRKMAENFDWIHTVDSLKIAQRLSDQRPEALAQINICLQINIDKEESKSGLLPNLQSLIELGRAISYLPNIKLRGLMCIPAPKDNKTEEINSFTRMNELMQQLNEHGLELDTLSMGMSNDLDSAISCGATIVRVGTAIFGERT